VGWRHSGQGGDWLGGGKNRAYIPAGQQQEEICAGRLRGQLSVLWRGKLAAAFPSPVGIAVCFLWGYEGAQLADVAGVPLSWVCRFTEESG